MPSKSIMNCYEAFFIKRNIKRTPFHNVPRMGVECVLWLLKVLLLRLLSRVSYFIKPIASNNINNIMYVLKKKNVEAQAGELVLYMSNNSTLLLLLLITINTTRFL